MNKILGKSGKVRDNRLNSYKNDLFSPLLRDFGNLKCIFYSLFLFEKCLNRQNLTGCIVRQREKIKFAENY